MRRIMYLAVVSLFVAIFPVTFAVAQDGTTATEKVSPPVSACAWTGTYTFDMFSHYFGTTVDATFANQGVAQEAITTTRCLDHGKGAVSFTVWNSTGFRRWYQNNAYETDVDLNVSRRIGKYDASIGGWMFHMNPNNKTDVAVVDAKVSRTFARGKNVLTPYAEVQHYGLTNRATAGCHGGSYPMVGVAYDRKLTNRISVASLFHENYDANGGFGFKSGKSLFYVEAGLRIALGERIAITVPRLGYGGGWNDPGRPKKTTWSSGIAWSF
jgi:hypothetical protein